MGQDVIDWYRLERYKFNKLLDLVIDLHDTREVLDKFWQLFHDESWQPLDEGWENAR